MRVLSRFLSCLSCQRNCCVWIEPPDDDVEDDELEAAAAHAADAAVALYR